MSYIAKDLSIISENLGSLYEDGLEFDMAFSLLEDIPLSKKYRDSLKHIKESILRGKSLAEAFGEYSELYPEFFVGLIRIGETSGNLGKILISISKFYNKQEKIKSEIRSASIYPIFLLASLFLLGIFLMFFIVPNFYNIFSENIEKLPKVVELVYNIRNSLIGNPIICFIFFICWGICIPIILFKSANKKGIIGAKLLKIKIIRDIYEYILILVLSIIFESGIPINLGIELAITSIKTVSFKNELKIVNKRVLKGEELSCALSKTVFISKYTLAMISLGENSGSLVGILNKLEKKLDDNINKSIDRKISLVQPTIIIGMAVSVGLFIVIFILPMFDMLYSGVR